MSVKEKRFWIECVCLLLLAMSAIALLGEVSRQAWPVRRDAFPAVTEQAYTRRARELLDTMTAEEKAGQIFYGCRVNGAADDAERYALGGVLLDSGLTERERQLIERSYPPHVFVSSTVPRFSGLHVVTDVRRSYVQAVRDGADMVVTKDYSRGIAQVMRAVECGALPEARLDEAVTKILIIKLRLNMIV